AQHVPTSGKGGRSVVGTAVLCTPGMRARGDPRTRRPPGIWGLCAGGASVSARDLRAGRLDVAQRAPREQQIFPRLRLVDRRAQQVRRVIRDDQRRAAVAVHAIAKARDRRVDAEQRARGAFAERDDQIRRDELDLPIEVGAAGGGLERLRRAIVGRAALEDVRDEYAAAAREPERREHVVEELAGGADERLA